MINAPISGAMAGTSRNTIIVSDKMLAMVRPL